MSSASADGEHVYVACRFRPVHAGDPIFARLAANQQEHDAWVQGAEQGWQIRLREEQSQVDINANRINESRNSQGTPASHWSFQFDAVLGPESTQRGVFERLARQPCENVLAGFNATIMACKCVRGCYLVYFDVQCSV